MPDPISLGLKEQDLADLTGYLLSFKIKNSQKTKNFYFEN
jgi:hypothetical protein